MKTFSIKPADLKKKWHLIDAQNLILGRLAVVAANILRGKHKPEFTPHVDCGDNVIIINAEKVDFTGNKWHDKEYVRHTGFPGGQRFTRAEEMLKKKPIEVIEHAVRGMLPKNRLGREIFRNLHVYTGSAHPHEAQKPKNIEL